MKTTNIIAVITLGLATVACTSKPEKNIDMNKPITEKIPDAKDNWVSLFDGETTTGWRGYNADAFPDGWTIEDGMLKSLGQGGDIGGDIIYAVKEFEDFELSLEWKISSGGNSGIFYHVIEGEQYKAPYENAPEYQLIDDINFPEKLEEWQKTGADYAMYTANLETKVVKPAGEWNTSRIVFQKDNVEYWLNGQKVVQFVPWSDDWMTRRNAGKWENMPDYGKAKKGYIGLQDHGSFIWFKNIKARSL